MSSVAIEKFTKQAFCGGQLNHVYRQNKNYSNQDIDLNKTPQNEYFGGVGVNAARKKLAKRVAEVDAALPPLRVRKDRVVCVGFVVVAPREGMEEDEEKRFLSMAYNKLEELFGKENMICGVSHFDEKHKYHDHSELHDSRGHLHAYCVPYVEGKGCNGKQFLTKDTYKRVNEAMDELCEEMYGFKYQDGTKAPSRGKVEELKQAEEIIKAKESIIEKLQAKLELLETLLDKFKAKVKYANIYDQAMMEAEEEFERERERGKGRGR